MNDKKDKLLVATKFILYNLNVAFIAILALLALIMLAANVHCEYATYALHKLDWIDLFYSFILLSACESMMFRRECSEEKRPLSSFWIVFLVVWPFVGSLVLAYTGGGPLAMIFVILLLFLFHSMIKF